MHSTQYLWPLLYPPKRLVQLSFGKSLHQGCTNIRKNPRISLTFWATGVTWSMFLTEDPQICATVQNASARYLFTPISYYYFKCVTSDSVRSLQSAGHQAEMKYGKYLRNLASPSQLCILFWVFLFVLVFVNTHQRSWPSDFSHFLFYIYRYVLHGPAQC